MASRSLNRIVLIGNLTRDPELKYTPTGTAICTFSIATNRSWTTNDGQTKEEVQYHRVVAWQKLAELCGKLLNKGRKVFAEGRMTYRTFTGKDGIQRTIAEIVLDDFIVFGEGRKMTEGVETDKKVEAMPANENVTVKTEEAKSELSKEETVNPDDIPF
ncbi:MAG TPA: single-stranded DNA-binding protein [Patescibacteria group bacterium]|jgi:single-strand DNA-binding protein